MSIVNFYTKNIYFTLAIKSYIKSQTICVKLFPKVEMAFVSFKLLQIIAILRPLKDHKINAINSICKFLQLILFQQQLEKLIPSDI